MGLLFLVFREVFECHKTKAKTKPITYQLDYLANHKPCILPDYFKHSIENCPITNYDKSEQHFKVVMMQFYVQKDKK